MKKIFAILLLFTILLTVIPTAAIAQTTINNETEEHILNELKRARIPNAAIAIVQDDEVSYILKDSAHDTLFQIGSVAKSFTGFGILLLEDMGFLSVEDSVNQHLSWFEVLYNGDAVPHEDITIANLLHHTSGFTSNERRFPSTISLTKEEFIAQLIGVELEFYPSTAHVYGNVNYIVLGFIIEAVSGQSYDEFMTQQVLHPLGMYNTFTNAQNAYETGRVIGGHRLGFMQTRAWNPPVAAFTIPTGYIYSNITDMAHWANVQLGSTDISAQFERVIQRSHESGYAFREDSVNPFADKYVFYAAGWAVDLQNGSVAHSGSTPGYLANVHILTYEDIAIVVLGNLNGGLGIGHRLGNLVIDALEGEPFDRAQTDMFVFMDIAFIIFVIIGFAQICMLVRIIIKVKKRLDNGEIIKARFGKKNISWLFDPVLSIMGIIAFYVVPSIWMDTSREFIVLFAPSSLTWAGVAIWVMAVYSLFSFWVKIFVSPR